MGLWGEGWKDRERERERWREDEIVKKGKGESDEQREEKGDDDIREKERQVRETKERKKKRVRERWRENEIERWRWRKRVSMASSSAWLLLSFYQLGLLSAAPERVNIPAALITPWPFFPLIYEVQAYAVHGSSTLIASSFDLECTAHPSSHKQLGWASFTAVRADGRCDCSANAGGLPRYGGGAGLGTSSGSHVNGALQIIHVTDQIYQSLTGSVKTANKLSFNFNLFKQQGHFPNQHLLQATTYLILAYEQTWSIG